MRLDVALSGVQVKLNGKTQDLLLLNCGPRRLSLMLKEILDNKSKPLNITKLIASMRFGGEAVPRGAIVIDLATLEKAGIITCDNSWRETLIKPKYSKFSVRCNEDGRTCVELS